MDFNEYLRISIIAYGEAWKAWKFAPEGQEKVDAKRERGRLHNKVLELADMCERAESPSDTSTINKE